MAYYCDGLDKSLAKGGVRAQGETFAHNDGSWPCLKGIQVAQDANLHYIVPIAYFEDGSSSNPYHMSLQDIPIDQRATSTQTVGFPTYTLFNGYKLYTRSVTGSTTIKYQRTTLGEQSVSYTSQHPEVRDDSTLGLGSVCHQVDSCADVDFFPPDTRKWTQYGFTATVSAKLYAADLQVTKMQAKMQDSSANCVLDADINCQGRDTPQDLSYTTYGHHGCAANTMVQNSPDPFGDNMCIAASGTLSCNQGGTQDTYDAGVTNGTSVSRNFVSANFRDGYQRLQAEACIGGVCSPTFPAYLTPNQSSVCGNGKQVPRNAVTISPLVDAGQLYTGYVKPNVDGDRTTDEATQGYNVPDQVQFSGSATCAQPPNEMKDQNAMVMMDVDGQDLQPRKVFVNLKWVGSGPKPLFAQSNEDYVQSFNVVARMPTCLSQSDAQPSTSTKEFDSLDYRSTACYHNDLPENPWKWQKNVDLGHGTGTYGGGIEAAWNDSDSAFARWPSISDPQYTDHPDIVVRLVFANTFLIQLDTGNPVPLTIQDASFQDHLIQVLGQNKPGAALTADMSVTESLLSSDMMQTAFLEYMGAILYRALFANNLTRSKLGTIEDRWFGITTHLLSPRYESYDAAEYFQDYFDTFLPLFRESDSATSVLSTIGSTITTMSQNLVQDASLYFRFPRIRIDEDQTFWVDFYCDVLTHVNLLNSYDGTTIQQYLRNMYQDSQLASIQSSTSTPMAPGSAFTAPDITLSGTPSHDPTQNLVWKGNDIEYTTSYYWTQQISHLSAVSFIWLGTQLAATSKPDWISAPSWQNVTSEILDKVRVAGVPQLVSLLDKQINQSSGQTQDLYSVCLNTKPISVGCQQLLCPQSGLGGCLCDYSILLDSDTPNPKAEIYFNNSLGACACLANQSYPIGADDNVRANNPITRCFSKACLEYGVETNINCSTVGCDSFSDAVSRANRKLEDGTWQEVFGDSGSQLDVQTLNRVCKTNAQTDITGSDRSLNVYALGAALCLGLAIPIGFGLDWIVTKQVRSIAVYLFGLAGWIVCCVGGFGMYRFLDAQRTCDNQYSYNDVNQGACVDGIFGQARLSEDVCSNLDPTFCQCRNPQTACDGGYLQAVSGAMCTNAHMCCVCGKNCAVDETVSQTISLAQGVISTNVAAISICAWILCTIIVLVTMPAMLGRSKQIWTGKAFVAQPGMGVQLRWVLTGLVLVVISGGVGMGMYFGSKSVAVKQYQVNKQLQESSCAL